jgi:hypothetical protein
VNQSLLGSLKRDSKLIAENQTPSMFALTSPPSIEDANARLIELIHAHGMEDGLVWSMFDSLDQLTKALELSFFYVQESKKPVKNTHSQTHYLKIERRTDGAEFMLVVNVFGGVARILNCVMTCKPKGQEDDQN